MSTTGRVDAVRRALAQRLRAAAGALLDEHTIVGGEPTEEAAHLVVELVRRARKDVTSAPTWLLLTALTGAMPDDAAVRSTRRLLATEPVDAAAARLLDDALTGLLWSDPLVEIEVLEGAVLVDVDYSARHDLNTGIQRAVRHTVPRWSRDHTVTLVAWASFEAYRRLDAVEAGRVLEWSGPVGEPPQPGRTRHVVVPWRSVVLLPEVPASRVCPPLAALAEHSGNRVGLVGYDCIPVVSADLMPPLEPERFVHYLTVVKHADHVCGISAAAAEEFRGFADTMVSQGLPGPVVTQCQLPVDAPPEPVAASSDPSSAPMVLVVGSHEPRKNHLGVLHASEVLWREGLRFGLRFVGGSSWASGPFDKQVASLRRKGRDVATQRGVGDPELWAAYRAARFTVFTSVHEGYGLPVAESLAVGTPVITSDLGSMREIAAGGGTILIDPRDDVALTDAMRRLLTDDEVRSALARQAAQRTLRTWDDFAADAWDQLVAAWPQEGRPA